MSINDINRDQQPHLSTDGERCKKLVTQEFIFRAENRTLPQDWTCPSACYQRQYAFTLSFHSLSGCAELGLRSGKENFKWNEKLPHEQAIFPPCMTCVFFFGPDLVLTLLPSSSTLTHVVTDLWVQEGKYYTQSFFGCFFRGISRK